MKNVMKEIIIFILILTILILLLGILFYEYIPSSKIVPARVTPYVLPEDIEEELAKAEEEKQNIVKTYAITSRDLAVSVDVGRVKKGKVNPFAPIGETNTSSSQSGNKSNSNSSAGDNTNTKNNTTNTGNTTKVENNTNAGNTNSGGYFNTIK